jgi:hypothetical protein
VKRLKLTSSITHFLGLKASKKAFLSQKQSKIVNFGVFLQAILKRLHKQKCSVSRQQIAARLFKKEHLTIG